MSTHFSKKIEEISTQVNDLTTALGIEDTTKELKEKSTKKVMILKKLYSRNWLKYVQMILFKEFLVNKEQMNSDKGDHVIEISSPSDEKLT